MRYQNEHLREISFPLGGIGTGSIGLAGNGHLVDWEIRNRANKGNMNSFNGFFLRAEYPDGRVVAKVLQGDWTTGLTGEYSRRYYAGFGFGPESCTFAALPHFREVTFDGRFPIATLTFADADFPARVELTAFNPFIPLNADDSSLPAAFFTLRVKNGAERVRCTVALVTSSVFPGGKHEVTSADGITAVTLRSAEKDPDAFDYGDMTAAVEGPGFTQAYWYRGAWSDGISTFWREFVQGDLHPREYAEGPYPDTATLGTEAALAAGEEKDFRFVLAWNAPNNCNDWEPYLGPDGKPVTWKNYYATKLADSRATAGYALAHFGPFYEQTRAFRDALHGSTLDPAVIDAAASTLSVLKSPTVWRLTDGTFYGWEGVHEKFGSCEGTCTHVWSYAYALCFLFPELERSLRKTEFTYDLYPEGGIRFRTKLPIDRPDPPLDFPPCVDGQMATVFKCYREWKISGDTDWLRENWPFITRTLEYAWHPGNPHRWDTDKDGVLEGRQHHTLDMELFGPSSWLEGMYLAALKAAVYMAEALGDAAKAEEYGTLFDKGYAWTKAHLFNGQYFTQIVDLTDPAPTEAFGCPNYWNEEKGQLKYQIGQGSILDQMLGQWHAALCGLGDIFDPEQRRTALRAMMRNNFKPRLREVDNMWRVFALNDEAGSIICDYPEGAEKPIIPIPYCEECMTGFEYAFAGLLVSEGMIEEALTVVRAIRDRYDGEKRNPYNEIECGSNYARPMASFGLLALFAGFTYDLPHGAIGFAPRLPGPFRVLWSLGTGWGTFETDGKTARIRLLGGYLELSALTLGGLAPTRLTLDGKTVPFTRDGDTLTFARTRITGELAAE